VLEEIEVTPRELLVVMGLAQPTALGTGMVGAPIRAKRQVDSCGTFSVSSRWLTICQGGVSPRPRAKMSPVRIPPPPQGKATVTPSDSVNSTLRVEEPVFHGHPPGRTISGHLPTENPERPHYISPIKNRIT